MVIKQLPEASFVSRTGYAVINETATRFIYFYVSSITGYVVTKKLPGTSTVSSRTGRVVNR